MGARKGSSGSRPRPAKKPAGKTSTPPLWERLVALANQVPDEELVGRPTDMAEQHDHYIYGTRKRG